MGPHLFLQEPQITLYQVMKTEPKIRWGSRWGEERKKMTNFRSVKSQEVQKLSSLFFLINLRQNKKAIKAQENQTPL